MEYTKEREEEEKGRRLIEGEDVVQGGCTIRYWWIRLSQSRRGQRGEHKKKEGKVI